MMQQTEYIITNFREVLNFLKKNYPLYHLSNVFFRDIQFGMIKYFESKNQKLQLRHAERVAIGFIEFLKKQKILFQINEVTWKLNYPDFVAKPPVQKQPSAATTIQK